MKILKSLNNKIFLITLISLLSMTAYAEEKPIDIWNINENKIEENSTIIDLEENKNSEIKINNESEIYIMQSQKKENSIELGEISDRNDIQIYGLYDPEDYELDINMWSNSNGVQLKNIFLRLSKIDLSDDANEIINITLLTNAYSPALNISEEEFLKLRSEWLIKNSDLTLIEEYLIKNQNINLHPKLTKYLLDQYLSEVKIKQACKFLSKNTKPIEDEYLSKFNIYCLIKSDKVEEAQIIFDLKKELGFEDDYFEKKVRYLLGFTSEVDNLISEKTIFDFHLAHQTNPNFFFEPNNNTSKLIWKYLASSNLLSSFDQIEIS